MMSSAKWCPNCHARFSTHSNRNRHYNKPGVACTTRRDCNICSLTFIEFASLEDHFDSMHPDPTQIVPRIDGESSSNSSMEATLEPNFSLDLSPMSIGNRFLSTSEIFREQEQMIDSPLAFSHSEDGILESTCDHASLDGDFKSLASSNDEPLVRQVSFDFQLAPNQNFSQSLAAECQIPSDNLSVSENSSINSLEINEAPPDIDSPDPVVSIHSAEEELMILIRTNNLSPELFEKISSWAKEHSDKGYNFNLRHYKTIMKHLKIKYGKEAGGEPVQSSFTIENFPPTHIYRNQFIEHARRIFSDSKLMDGALMKYEDNDLIYSELNTATWWKNCEIFIAERMEPGCKSLPPNHYIAPVILFDDSTLLDNIGRLTAHPVLCSFGNICGKKRRSHTAWFLLGFIPPYPKTAEEKCKDTNKMASKQDHNIYYHRCLEHLFTDFKKITDNVNGEAMYVHGYGNVFIHFELSYIIGDTMGQDPMCGKNAGYGTNTARLVRDCNISTEQGDDPNLRCTFNKVRTIKNIVKRTMRLWNEKKLNDTDASTRVREISQLLFSPVYWDYPFGGDESGVHGCLPIEILHVFLLGPMKDLLQTLFSHTEVPFAFQDWYEDRVRNRRTGSMANRPTYAGAKKRKCLFRQAEFERRFRSVTRAASRQSDRHVPRCPFKNGVTTLTRLCGQEYPGLCLLTMVCLEGIINVEHESGLELEKKYCYLLWMSLSLEVLITKEEYTERSLKDIEKKINFYLRCYREICGPQREVHSGAGLRTTKYHSLKHFPYYIRKFGSPHNFSGTYLEAALKPYLKEQTKRTTRRHNRYLLDLMNRFHELMVIWTLQRDRDRTTSSTEKTEQVNATADFDYRLPKKPAFIMEFSESKESWTTTNITGTTKRSRSDRLFHPKQDDTVGLSWMEPLCDTAADSKYNFVYCYYSCNIPSSSNPQDIFRCDPDYRSYPWNRRGWFDWAMVELDGVMVAARIRLWGNMKNDEDDEGELFAVVQPLHSTKGSSGCHHVFTWMQANTVSDDLICVEFDQIKEVAFVLPASQPLPEECREGNNQQAEQVAYPDDVSDHRYYIVIPPRSTWDTNGWEDIQKVWNPW